MFLRVLIIGINFLKFYPSSSPSFYFFVYIQTKNICGLNLIQIVVVLISKFISFHVFSFHPIFDDDVGLRLNFNYSSMGFFLALFYFLKISIIFFFSFFLCFIFRFVLFCFVLGWERGKLWFLFIFHLINLNNTRNTSIALNVDASFFWLWFHHSDLKLIWVFLFES